MLGSVIIRTSRNTTISMLCHFPSVFCEENFLRYRHFKCLACPPKRSHKTLRVKFVPRFPIVSAVGNFYGYRLNLWPFYAYRLTPLGPSLLLFFLFKSPGGHVISFQIKPWVAFGLPYLLIELFYIGMPVVWTDGRSVGVRSPDYQIFSDG